MRGLSHDHIVVNVGSQIAIHLQLRSLDLINTCNEISIYEAILARKSIRQYTAQKVEAKQIRSLLEAAVMAPTTKQHEPWAFTIIQDTQWLKAISDNAKSMLIKQPAQDGQVHEVLGQSANIFYDANTLIVICAETDNQSAVADCWMAAENIMLAACAMGLGSCVISSALDVLNDNQEKLKLGLNGNFVAVAPIVIGFPRGKTALVARKKPLILNWIEA